MRKVLRLSTGLFLFCLILSCSGEKKSGAGRPRVIMKGNGAGDSTVWYDAEIGTRQRSYPKELAGPWMVTVMHRQQKAAAEKLTGITLDLAPDSTAALKAHCNSINARYLLKGTSIKFTNIVSGNIACNPDNQERETAFLKLLGETVSAYSVSAEKLLLRDGASNIVFECEKQH